MQKALLQATIKAVASQRNPLHTNLQLILTDFLPNGNKQGIPLTEKENILSSAQFAPLKINFNGDEYSGHVNAVPIGTITSAYEGVDGDRDIILGEAVLWNDLYPDIESHLKNVFADEGVGTSWEIYYSDSEKDDNNITWLKNCTFAGTCVVDVPAYGPQRTRVLAIAERINDMVKDEVNTSQDEKNIPVDEVLDVGDNKAAADILDDTYDANDLLFKLWEGLDTLYSKIYEVQQEQATKDLATIAQTFADKIKGITNKLEEMQASVAELKTERDTLVEEKAQAELEKKIEARKKTLASAGVHYSNDELNTRKYIINFSDEEFNDYVSDLTRNKATAEKKKETPDLIPEPLGENQLSVQDLAAAIRNNKRN